MCDFPNWRFQLSSDYSEAELDDLRAAGRAIRRAFPEYRFRPSEYFLAHEKNGGFFVPEDDLSYWRAVSDKLHRDRPALVQTPCGQCTACRLNYSKEWAARIMIEAKEYEHNYFVTLTYDNDHIPDPITTVFPGQDDKSCFADDLFIGEMYPLIPDHVDKFKHDLRQILDRDLGWQGVRFYLCGEYGSRTYRPHFHIILFNMPELKKGYAWRSESGNITYENDLLARAWSVAGVPRGRATFGEVTWDSAAYVARYVMKKQIGFSKRNYERQCDHYDVPPLPAEFVRMSTHPGLARAFYDRNADQIYSLDQLIIAAGVNKVQKVKPPRYYDRLFDLDHAERLTEVKAARLDRAIKYRIAERVKIAAEGIDPVEYEKRKRDIRDRRLRKLVRSL